MAATNQIQNVGEDDKVMTSFFNKPFDEKRKKEGDVDEKRFKTQTKQILWCFFHWELDSNFPPWEQTLVICLTNRMWWKWCSGNSGARSQNAWQIPLATLSLGVPGFHVRSLSTVTPTDCTCRQRRSRVIQWRHLGSSRPAIVNVRWTGRMEERMRKKTRDTFWGVHNL